MTTINENSIKIVFYALVGSQQRMTTMSSKVVFFSKGHNKKLASNNPIEKKLYGNLPELETIAQFIPVLYKIKKKIKDWLPEPSNLIIRKQNEI